MTTMITEVYDALREAGAGDEKARRAAEVLASYDDRFSRIERKLAVMSWQIGALAAVQLAVGLPALWLLVRVAGKIGAI